MRSDPWIVAPVRVAVFVRPSALAAHGHSGLLVDVVVGVPLRLGRALALLRRRGSVERREIDIRHPAWRPVIFRLAVLRSYGRILLPPPRALRCREVLPDRAESLAEPSRCATQTAADGAGLLIRLFSEGCCTSSVPGHGVLLLCGVGLNINCKIESDPAA